MFHTQDTPPRAAPGLWYNRDFRRALLFGGALSGAFWLAAAYLVGRFFLSY